VGALARALGQLGSVLSVGAGPLERKTAIGARIPTWEAGDPQYPYSFQAYHQYALSGYSANEICYACIEELATSAAEPRLVAVRKKADGEPEQLHDHPVLELFEHPNPFLSRFQMIASTIMYRCVAGNAYLEIVRSAAGKPVELWPLRPDRMFVIPDNQRHVGGYEYRLGDQTYRLDPADVIHSKTRHPMDDWYGLPPLAACAPRVDTDSFMRAFTLAFFRNAGVPAGLLNITKQVGAAERQMIRDRLRGETGGPANWHQLLVLDNTEATYVPMGLPLGSSGIVLPELDEISEARIAMALGVPLELIGARLGMVHGNRSTTLAARGTFWDETLIPLYQELAADLSRGLVPEYAGTPDEFDYLEFDISCVKALQEDDDAKHKRIREDLAAGLLSIQEARTMIGQEPEYDKDALLILNRGLEPMTPQTAQEGAPPYLAPVTAPNPLQPPPAAQTAPGGPTQATGDRRQATENGNSNGRGNGKKPLSKDDLAQLARLAAGKE
jgi:HK97 family phage portal protein